MNRKYSNKLVFDYIVGNEIIDYDIDELENDYEFMIEVIKHTKDKKIYNLCSDEVKSNYNFVKFMVETFKNDLNFICDIANNYLMTADKDDIKTQELVVLVSESVDGDIALENPKLCDYKLHASTFYEIELFNLSLALEDANEKIKEEYGLGFLYVLDEYSESNIICDFFAKRMINELFYENEEYTLEQMLHINFKTIDSLKTYGINKFLTSYIKKYDKCLASHVTCHLELLDPVKKSISRIEKNWNNYIDRVLEEKVNIYENKVEEYVDTYGMTIGTSILINYIIKKLHLEDIFYKYDTFLKEFNNMELTGFNDIFDEEELEIINLIDEKNMNFQDLRCVKYATKLAVEMFKQNSVDIIRKEYYQEESVKKKPHIFKIDFKKNNTR